MKALLNIVKMANKIATNLTRVNDANIEAQFPQMIRDNWSQLDQGKKNDDNPITPLYAPFTQKKKGFSIPNLKDTGDFRNSFDIDYRPGSTNPLVWGAGDEKAEDLWDKYTFDVMGLNEKNTDKNVGNIQKKTNNYINKEVAKIL